ncbi:MAG: CRISPR-associated endonuclease Cas2 [Syntrophaceae bacterium]|nr:CRISPR-associated endonuclease Cas2 [Syntrophaceae bacterium]
MIAAGAAIPATILMPNIPTSFKPLIKELIRRNRPMRRHSLLRSIGYLKRNDFVSVAERGGQQILTLTKKGEKRVLSFYADKMAIRKPRKWDRKWRIVIFDIPETRKQGREALRNKLKELGFLRLQKSCFIHPFDCRSEIEFLCGLFEVYPYVNFIVAREIEGEESFRKLFGLY